MSANVIWCTGFDLDFGWIHLPVIAEDGWPRQERGVAADAPGLYFLGLLFQYGFSSMLVVGAGRDAAYLVDRVVERRQAASPAATRPSPVSAG